MPGQHSEHAGPSALVPLQRWAAQKAETIEAERMAEYTARMEALKAKAAKSPFRSRQLTAADEAIHKHR